jgi:hypothetical protein
MAASVWIMSSRVRSASLIGPVQGADHACRQGAGQPEGVADGENFLAYLQVIRVAQFQEGQFLAGRDLDQRQVAARIVGQDLSAVPALIVEGDLQLPRVAFDDVAVGQDQPVFADEKPGAGAGLGHDLEEPRFLVNHAGDVDGGGRRSVVNLDVVALAGIKRRLSCGALRVKRGAGCAAGAEDAAGIPVCHRGQVEESAGQQRSEQQKPGFHRAISRKQ